MSEFTFIESIKKLIPSNTIDDDCAIIPFTKLLSKKDIIEETNLLVSTDTFVENTHFSFDYYSFFNVGYKSLAVNISDIAACGGLPVFFSVSVTITPKTTEKDIIEIYKGFIPLINRFNLILSGGDVVKGDKLSITITIFGKTDTPLKRNTSQIGNYVYVTGEIGSSAYALYLLLNKIIPSNRVLKKHLSPEPRIELIQSLKAKYNITSAIDISDGLSLDLSRLMHSNTGFDIDFEKIPINCELQKESEEIINKCVLYGGEDYEILFTSSDRIKENFVYNIGMVTDSREIVTSRNKTHYSISPFGYDHFA